MCTAEHGGTRVPTGGAACEVNEKGTREKNDCKEGLSLDDNEKIEMDSEAESFVEEDWNDQEQEPKVDGTRFANNSRNQEW